MNIRHFLTMWIAATLLALPCTATPTVSGVVARQRDQCNGLVDIDYTLGGDIAGMAVDITVTDRTTGRTYRPITFTVRPSATSGTHRATWSPFADGLTVVSTGMVATVSLYRTSDWSPAPDGILYLVVDLSGGANAVSYPVSYLSAVPSGGWTDEYKSTKLVLRRIPAGMFAMGSRAAEGVTQIGAVEVDAGGSVITGGGAHTTTVTEVRTNFVQYVERYPDEKLHDVMLPDPFYMGVFEVTRVQWELVMGVPSDGDSCMWTEDGELVTDDEAMMPAASVSYNMIRGESAGAGWPWSSAVDATSFLGVLRKKTGLMVFDLPTEAQWEYACRAGTTTALNSGRNLA